MQVTLHTPETIYSARHIPSWLLLAGAAGFVNGFAFLVCEQFVTNVTGLYTMAGLEMRHLGIAFEYVIVLVGFIAGAAVAVVAAQMRARMEAPDRWVSPLLGVVLILIGVAIAGHLEGFDPIGSRTATDPPPALLLSLLAFAAGLQNSTVSSTTCMAVRTTHLTGPTTDIGMLLGAACLSSGAERRSALAGAGLRVGMALAFVLGAVLSVVATPWAGYLALLFPAGFVLVAGKLSFIPNWGPSDLPFHPEGSPPPPPGKLAGLPKDAHPRARKPRNDLADLLAEA